MNIIVRPYGGGSCYCRPDTTWERESKDFYSPECADALYWTPVVFARICKAGKCIGEKFVSRYYDAVGFGLLLYIGDKKAPLEIAYASCADHTSLLPMPLYNPVVLDNPDNDFEVIGNDVKIWGLIESAQNDSRKLLESVICRSSKLTSLRIGDFVAAELAPVRMLVSREKGSFGLRASYCENDLFDVKIVF